MYGRIVIPQAVFKELQHDDAPAQVQRWLAALPDCVEVREVRNPDMNLNLDEGEREAITLAERIRADLVQIDERKGRIAAVERGLAVTGTIGILGAAAERGLVDLTEAVTSLRQSNFRVPESLLQWLIEHELGD